MKKLLPFKRDLARLLKHGAFNNDPDKKSMARRIINSPESKEPIELPKREWYTPREIRLSRFNKLMVIYTKCNKACNESLESHNYREMWGILLPNGRMRVQSLSVIRGGVITDRSICDLRGIRDIQIHKDTRLIIIDMKRYANP